ncbi:hypothetical protein [Staphylococcus xylosus]|uniref:hypothetical protein n=1 Tax=Staphylococcus xylosus TaxID=1288 RepID=UPI0013A07DE9|nr:hypothetical protein [Staphylococcus xylosus]
MKSTKNLKPVDIDTFYREILPKYSIATMKNIRTRLSAILNYGISFYDLPKNPANIVSLPKKGREAFKILDCRTI